jgi:hypothetical protein
LNERRLRLELQPSRLLAAAIVASHCAAGACAWLVLRGAPGAALAAALAGLGLASAWDRALHRSRRSVQAMALDGPRLQIVLRSGESLDAEVAERRYVNRFMVSLRVLRPVRRNVLVTRDMLEGDLFRRLRIWALWGKLPRVAAKQLPA